MQTKLLLLLLLTFGLLLRIYNVEHIPAGFFADEASIGYNAYTILTKGTDEYGVTFPVFFQAFGEYKGPIQIYTTVPFIKIFGLNEFAIRLPSALFGMLTIVGVYLLTKELLKILIIKQPTSEIISLLSAFFLAISPWHIHISRVALEGQTAFIFFTTMGLYVFLKSQHYPRLLLLSVLLFTCALYSYFPARLFIPLFTISICLLFYRFFLHQKKITLIALFFLIALLTPLTLHLLSGIGLSRWQQVSIFTNPPKEESITEHIVNNYISHFSLDFLFLKGDIGMPGQFITRHSVRGMGQAYLFQFPLIILGILFLIKRKQRQTFFLLLAWLILYPIGSMLTVDKNAQATRSIIGVIPFQILSAIGLFYIIVFLLKVKKIIRCILILGLALCFIFSFSNFLKLYYVEYPKYSSDFWGWQYGAKEIVEYFITEEKNYEELIMAPAFNAPYIFFKFYAPNACKKCVVGLQELYNPKKKQLFALTPNYIIDTFPGRFNIKKTIFYPNLTIAFYIGEIVE